MQVPFERPDQLHSLPVLLDPYPFYRWLRDGGAVRYAEGLQAWLVSGYDAACAVLRDPKMSSRLDIVPVDHLSADEAEQLEPLIRLGRSWMQQADPPAHTAIRNPWVHLFGAATAARASEVVRTYARDMLERAAAEGELEVIEAFTPVPALVLGEALGLSPDDMRQMQPYVQDYVAFREDPTLERGVVARASVARWKEGLLRRLDDERARGTEHPLLRIRDAHGDEALFATVASLMAGRYEPTIGVIGNGILAMLQHADQLVDAPSTSITALTNEILRYDTSFQSAVRLTREAVSVGGVEIPAGSRVIVLLGAANRDPARFSEPERFLPERSESGALTFGLGSHYCLGATLARVTLEGVFDVVRQWLPQLRLSPGRPDWNFSVIGYRALRTLWLDVSDAPGASSRKDPS